MKVPFLPRFSFSKTFFQYPQALLGALLLCVVPTAAQAQSVTFAGAQTTLPTSDLDNPSGVAVDSAGDVFIGGAADGGVVELPKTATGYGPQVTLPFTGLGAYGAQGVAVDSAGDVFIAALSINSIVELPWTGTGYGPQTTLPFSGLDNPVGVAVDSAGDVFEGDYGPTLDGGSGPAIARELPKTSTGYGPQVILPFSGLSSVRGVVVDSAEDVFLADSFNARVLELPKTGTGYGPQIVLPFSGLSGPWGVAVDSAGDVFVADFFGEFVAELPWTGTGYGPEITLPFSGLSNLAGVAVDSAGDVFLSDFINKRVLELQRYSVNFGGVNICPAGQTTPAPCSETLTLNFTVTASGVLGTPKVLTLGAPNLDFTLASGSTCVGTVTEGATCSVNVTFAPRFAGERRGGVELVDGSGKVIGYGVFVHGIGSGPQVTFQPGTLSQLSGFGFSGINTNLAVDGSGNVFVSNGSVYEIVAAGGYTTVKTLDSSTANPIGIAVDGTGNVFVNDYNNDALREIWLDTGYTAGYTPAAIQAWGLAIDGIGNIFAAEAYDGPVVEIPYVYGEGYPTVKTLTAAYPWASGLAVDGSGNLFVADSANENVQEILAAGGYTTVNTLAGSQGIAGWGIALDASGNVFVADYNGGAVKEILAAGGYTTVRTLAAGYPYVSGVAVDGSGNVYFAASANGATRVFKLDYADPPSVLFPTPTAVGATDTADGPQTVSVWNSGNQPLLFATPATGHNPHYAADFPENSADASLCAAGLSLAAGMSCDVSMNFVPSAAGVNTGSVVLTDNALNQSGATQTIPLSGTGTASSPGAQVVLEFGTIAFGSTETVPLTITNSGGGILTITPSINGPSYIISGSTCGAGVTAGNSCTLQVEFIPYVVGTHNDILTLQTNGSTNPTVALDGLATGIGSELEVPLQFGTIPFGTTKILLLSITNVGLPGRVTFTAASNGPSYKVLTTEHQQNTCLVGIVAGQRCTLPIEFDPVDVGKHNDILTIIPSGAASSTVSLQGFAD